MVDSLVAGHRVWDPPDPIPNSEVKPLSVSGVSVVFGHVKPGKLAIIFPYSYILIEEQLLCCLVSKIFPRNTQNLLPTLSSLRQSAFK